MRGVPDHKVLLSYKRTSVYCSQFPSVKQRKVKRLEYEEMIPPYACKMLDMNWHMQQTMNISKENCNTKEQIDLKHNNELNYFSTFVTLKLWFPTHYCTIQYCAVLHCTERIHIHAHHSRSLKILYNTLYLQKI